MENSIISAERQAELIAQACKRVDLDGHIRWIEEKKDAVTWAEKIAMMFKGKSSMPVKNSYMMCDSLDMCFFYDKNGVATMTYSGSTSVGRPDIAEGKLIQAFSKANQVLEAMDELMSGAVEPFAEMDEECLRLYKKVNDSFKN